MRPDPDLLALLKDKPLFIARLTAQAADVATPVVAFAGIAKPWKFEATLKYNGFKIIEFQSFPDHTSPDAAQFSALEARAEASGARLIMTQKDWERLDPVQRGKVTCLPITARFEDEAGFLAALLSRLPGIATMP